MRSLIGLFGLICGAVVIWTVAQYGYASADDPAARWNTAFLFGVIAAGGLFGHAVAVRVGRVSKPWAVMIVVVCGAALVINLSNSLAALAGRNSRSAAESANQSRAIRNDQAELGRLQKALDRLGAFKSDGPGRRRCGQACRGCGYDSQGTRMRQWRPQTARPVLPRQGGCRAPRYAGPRQDHGGQGADRSRGQDRGRHGSRPRPPTLGRSGGRHQHAG
jgi:hypothetical protein